ncbi:MAG: hypothetical protein HQK83_20790 [Fibrobacteria bacterium]|nr:hypothetical protein [Fibrobacteria bacterium]
MAATVEEITINFEDKDGTLLVKELDKKILSKGAWATIMYKYQDLDKASGDYKKPKFSLRRYQKVNGEFRSKSKFNISSDDQARMIIDTLNGWVAE